MVFKFLSRRYGGGLQVSREIIEAVQAKLPSIIYFDESDYLRERTSDMDTLLQSIALLEPLYIMVDHEEQYEIASTLGYLYRVAGADDAQQLTKAEQYFKECLTYAINHQNVAKEITTLIRLGEVYKYGCRYDEACTRFHEVITICVTENNTMQLDFAHQHLGKCFIEMGKFAQAELQLLTALKLREKKGNESLINSTTKALELLAKLERDVR